MANLMQNKQALRMALESTYGTYAAPSKSVPIRGNPSLTPWKGDSIDRSDLVRPYWDQERSFKVAGYRTLDFTVDLAGSGTAATPPAWGDLLLMCAASENVLGSAITGTCQAGSASTTLKLAAGASSIDDFYVGMTVATTGGTGSGQTNVCIYYDGTTKVATMAVPWATTPDNTTTYSFAACVGYYPVSTQADTETSATFEWDQGSEADSGSVRRVLLGARGTASLDFTSGKTPTLRIAASGLLGTDSDATLPALDFSAWEDPVEVGTARTGGFLNIHGMVTTGGVFCVLQSLSFDMGNQYDRRNATNDESIRITGRKPTVKIEVASRKLSEKDWETALKANTTGPLCVRHGTTAGNILTLTAPALQVDDISFGGSNGILHTTISGTLNRYRSSGNDSFRITSG